MRTLIALVALFFVQTAPTLSTTVRAPRPEKPGISLDDAHLPVLRSTPLPEGAASVYLLQENFDGTFPPAGWTVINPDGGRTWERTTAASGYGSGTASARMRFYDYTPNAGQTDSLISPPVTGLGPGDSLSFDYATVPIPSLTVGPDTVEVWLSTDGGASWPTRLFLLSEEDSTGTGTVSPFIPDSGEWGTRRVLLPPSVSGNSARFLFLARNRFGQNFYLDNVRAGTQAVDDIGVVAQIAPPDGGYVIETFGFTPKATVRNFGTAALPAPCTVRFDIRDSAGVVVYTGTSIIDTLSPGATIQVSFDSLPSGVPAGVYGTRIITELGSDLIRTNDTLAGGFTADLYVRTLPYTADFEGPGDAGWSGRKVTGSRNQWLRDAPAKPLQLQNAFDGTTAWLTSLDSVYQDNQNAALFSPYLDLSAATDATVLEFHHNFLIETGFDGAILEYSTNGGVSWRRADSLLGTGPEFSTEWSRRWYNSSSNLGTPNPPKWSGSSTAYATHTLGWIRSTTPLGPLAGEPLVRFRWRFRTDDSEGSEGWAVDAVRIYEDTLKETSTSLAGGWNLLSLPVVSSLTGVQEIFPTSQFPYAFGFTPASGYVQSATVLQGAGYWLRIVAPGEVGLQGRPVYRDTVMLTPGWQILGSLSLPVAVDSLIQNPPGHLQSGIFVFVPGTGYEQRTYLRPWEAAWVKSTGGELILQGEWIRSGSIPAPPPLSPAAEKAGTLVVRDEGGEERSMVLGAQAGELPPPATRGDIRRPAAQLRGIRTGSAGLPLARRTASRNMESRRLPGVGLRADSGRKPRSPPSGRARGTVAEQFRNAGDHHQRTFNGSHILFAVSRLPQSIQSGIEI